MNIMNKQEKNRKEMLIGLLIDRNVLDADRDDAAMDLGEEFDDEAVLNTLIQIAINPNEINMILNSCGESIGKIWIKKDFFDEETYKNLTKDARDGVYCIIKNRKPTWMKKFHLD